MTWKLVVRPLARLQIAEALDWYDSRSSKAGDSFLQDVEQSLDAIRSNPYQYQTLRDELRRVILRRFPYMIIYGIAEDAVVVLRCVHGHRDPRRWPDGID